MSKTIDNGNTIDSFTSNGIDSIVILVDLRLDMYRVPGLGPVPGGPGTFLGSGRVPGNGTGYPVMPGILLGIKI